MGRASLTKSYLAETNLWENLKVQSVRSFREVKSSLSLGSRSPSSADPCFHRLCHCGKHLGHIYYRMKAKTVNTHSIMCTCPCRILPWNNFISENKALNSLINFLERRIHSEGLHCLPVDLQKAECDNPFSLRNPLRNLFWKEDKKFVVHKLQNWPLRAWVVQRCLPRVGSIALHCNARHRNLQLATGMFRACTHIFADYL